MESQIRSFAEAVFRQEGMGSYELVVVDTAPLIWVDGYGQLKGEISFARHRVVLYIPINTDLEDAKLTILHEVAHHKTGPEHSWVWRAEYERLVEKYL